MTKRLAWTIVAVVPALFLGAAWVGAWPSLASLKAFHIIMESRSPYYEPPVAKVTVGMPIQWENPTPSYHTVTHEGCFTGEACQFDSGSVAPDDRFTLPGLPPGQYPYQCRLHPIMRGVLTVVEGSDKPAQT
ncbi:MAG: cupredoxin domain-containing protein [Nitrospirales bacterium]